MWPVTSPPKYYISTIGPKYVGKTSNITGQAYPDKSPVARILVSYLAQMMLIQRRYVLALKLKWTIN